MRSKELLDEILEALSLFMRQGGSIADAFGALKVAKITLELTYCNAAREEPEAKNDERKDL